MASKRTHTHSSSTAFSVYIITGIRQCSADIVVARRTRPSPYAPSAGCDRCQLWRLQSGPSNDASPCGRSSGCTQKCRSAMQAPAPVARPAAAQTTARPNRFASPRDVHLCVHAGARFAWIRWGVPFTTKLCQRLARNGNVFPVLLLALFTYR